MSNEKYYRNICMLHLGYALSKIKSDNISDDKLIREISERLEANMKRVYWTDFENWFFETYIDKIDKIRTIISIFQTELLKEENKY